MTSLAPEPLPSASLDEIARKRPAELRASEWAVYALRTAMDAGVLTPGTQLTEEALAATLDVSRNTLRQAFTELEGQNLVQRIPHRGVFVARPDSTQVRELFIERWAVQAAALDLAPTGENKDARAALARAREARDAGSVDGMANANQDFHRALVAAAGSERLSRTMSRLLAEMRLLFFEYAQDGGFHAPYVEMNAHLLDLVEHGKRAAAHEALRSYLVASRDKFLQRQADS